MSRVEWFSGLPEGWYHVPLKRGVNLSSARCTGRDAEELYIGMEHIESWTGRLAPIDKQNAGCDPEPENGSTFNRFILGDVLFGKLRPYLAKAVIAPENGVCSTELLVLKPLSSLSQRYLLYTLLSQGFIRAVDSTTYGAKMPRAEWSLIGSLRVPVPPPSAQHALADYLDRETGRVDLLVTAKQRLLDILAEKRQALVISAVTRGLNENVSFRRTGLPWLREIPEHWEIRRIATLFKERDERGEPDLPMLTVSINTGVTEREFADDRIERVAEDFNTYKVARKGDIAFNKMRMWQGAVGVSPVDGLVSPDYVVAHSIVDLAIEYFGVLLRIPAMSAEFAGHSHGIVWDRLRLYWEDFRDIYVPFPPLSEQRAIAKFVSTETAKLDALRNATQRSIDLLKERRSALIAAAVTGQIDIPLTNGGLS